MQIMLFSELFRLQPMAAFLSLGIPTEQVKSSQIKPYEGGLL